MKYENDKVKGLKAKVKVTKGAKRIVVKFADKHSKGYDGCGTHTHQ